MRSSAGMHPLRLIAVAALATLTACGGEGGTTEEPPPPVLGSVSGRLASSAAASGGAALRTSPSRALSFDQVTVDLLQVSGELPREEWTVLASASPDAAGAFSFQELTEGSYSLRLQQPELADVRYGVDTTDFHLAEGQALNLVLPVITTILHGLNDEANTARIGGPLVGEAGLDPVSGELAVVSGVGFGLVDPGRGTMDVLLSHTLFDRGYGDPARVVFPPTPGLVWIVFKDRIVSVDRSIFSDPDASEVVDLEDPATRLAIGDRVRYRLVECPESWDTLSFLEPTYLQADERTLLVSHIDLGVVAIDLETAACTVVRPGGWLVGRNLASNRLFVADKVPFFSNVAAEVAVVDAATLAELAVIPLGGVAEAPMQGIQGAAPFPGDPRTLLLGWEPPPGGGLPVAHVKVVDGSGAVLVDQRARDYLGLAEDPTAGFPHFDDTGDYLALGETAYRILADGGFAEVPVVIPPGPDFERLFVGCAGIPRAVDTAHLMEIWFGCNDSVGILSLDQSNLPISAFPGVDGSTGLVDGAHGRAIFRGADRVVTVHYADPSASERTERNDLTGLAASFVAPGAACDASTPCSEGEICAAAEEGAPAGSCRPNPQLPYRPLCGGPAHAACDEGFTCEPVFPADPDSVGACLGQPDRDYAAHGPACGSAGACPPGMACGASDRCEPRACLRDADCGAGEVCGLTAALGRVCVGAGPLPDGAPCLGPEECQHGACRPISREPSMATGNPAYAAIYGYRGLMACTTPCFELSDCPAGSQCLYDGHAPLVLDGSVWSAHRYQPLPWCTPPEMSAASRGCTPACAANEVCDLSDVAGPFCRLGVIPYVRSVAGPPVCLPGAVVPFDPLRPCVYPCADAADCPWQTTCTGGYCDSD